MVGYSDALYGGYSDVLYGKKVWKSWTVDRAFVHQLSKNAVSIPLFFEKKDKECLHLKIEIKEEVNFMKKRESIS